MDELLLLSQYPPEPFRVLLAGTLPLKYCSARFRTRVPTWRLRVPGHAADLVHAGVVAEGDYGSEVGDEGGSLG